MSRAALILLCLFVPATFPADEPAKPKSPLAGLPSKPGPHVEKIKGLADNTWLELGTPAADPQWGKARGRSWSCKLPFAADLGGAFLYGEGVHGYAKPDGRYMDDLWLYDLNAHRWVCCYPGTDPKAELKINADGLETGSGGEVLAVATMAHAYEMVAYDSDAKRFMSMPCDGGYWKNVLKLRQEKPKSDGKLGPWMFDVAAGGWQRPKTPTAGPRSSFGDVLVYVPSKKQAFFWGKEGVAYYDPAAATWTRPKVAGPAPPFGIDPTACYDSKRDRIYMGGGSYPNAPMGENALWVYDLKADAWIDPKPKGAPCNGSTHYATNRANMAYDSANDKVVLFYHGDPKENRGVYVYDPAANSWSDGPVAKFEPPAKSVNAFYDPALNAHILHSAGDSRDDGTVWAYRLKAAR